MLDTIIVLVFAAWTRIPKKVSNKIQTSPEREGGREKGEGVRKRGKEVVTS